MSKKPIQNITTIFTPEEHAIFAAWFGVKPPNEVREIEVGEALETLGFTREPNGLYRPIDAAVASILLERVQGRLPQWAVVDLAAPAGERVLLARKIRERWAKRVVELVPRHLVTINWADSGPGYSWPEAYHVTWVPCYDAYAVTGSADSTDALGYCDFALGSFRREEDVVRAAGQILKDNWATQRSEFDQQRWAYVFDVGLIDESAAERLADEAWCDIDADADDEAAQLQQIERN
jgi:hypothetical protein